MQERLDDALERQGRHPELVRLKPDTFGLHAYPAQPYPANGTQAHPGAAAAARGDGGAARRRAAPSARAARGRRESPRDDETAGGEAEGDAEAATRMRPTRAAGEG